MTTDSTTDAAEVRAQQERAYRRRRRRTLAAKLLAGPLILAVFLLAFRDWRPAAQREAEDRRDRLQHEQDVLSRDLPETIEPGIVLQRIELEQETLVAILVVEEDTARLVRGKADLQSLMSRMEVDALREFCGDRELRRFLDYTKGLTKRYVDADNVTLYESTITRADCAARPAR